MRSIGRVTLVIAWALAVDVTSYGQQRETGTADPGLPPLGIIAGRVVTADTGAPVRSAQVRARQEGGGNPRLAMTDADGRFEIRDLFAGEWSVAVSKSGFITQSFGQRRPADRAATVMVAAGQRATATFPLVRAGAITGRVYDEFGEPLAAARVQVLTSRVARGASQRTSLGTSDVTDDTGAFRLYGLPPGDYYVGAAMRAADDVRTENTVGPPTYYPGTPALSDAQRITLGPGDEQSNINFQLLPVRAVRVSGFVLRASGAPAADASITLRSLADGSDAGSPVGNFGRTRPDGAFTIVNVAPGSYRVSASADADPRTNAFEEGFAVVTVTSDDVAGVTVPMSAGATLVGTVVAEPGTVVPPSLSLQVHALALDLDRRKGPFSGVDVDVRKPTFRMPNLFGAISLDVDGLPDTLMVRAVEVDGANVTDTPVDLRGRTANARIVLTSRVTNVAGTVTDGGTPVRDATVLVFADDVTRWRAPSRFVKAARTDADGRFSIGKLPPDERYLAVALEDADESGLEDPDYLERLRADAIDLMLGDGERKTVNLTPRRR